MLGFRPAPKNLAFTVDCCTLDKLFVLFFQFCAQQITICVFLLQGESSTNELPWWHFVSRTRRQTDDETDAGSYAVSYF